MTLNGQVLLNSLITASYGILMAMAVAQTYRLLRYFDLSLAAISLIAGYATIYCINFFEWPIAVSIIFAIICATTVHLLIKLAFPGFLYFKNNSSTLLITSLGIYICLLSILSLIFGTELVAPPSQQAGTIIQLPFGRITSVQAISITLSVILPSLYVLILNRIKLGMTIRAASSSLDLALIVGVHVKSIAIIVTILSAFFSSLAGVLLALDVGIRPTVGLQPILLGVVAVIIGIHGGVGGIVLVALLIALLQNFVAANMGPQWQDAIVFIILLIFLFIRAKGPLKISSKQVSM